MLLFPPLASSLPHSCYTNPISSRICTLPLLTLLPYYTLLSTPYYHYYNHYYYYTNNYPTTTPLLHYYTLLYSTFLYLTSSTILSFPIDPLYSTVLLIPESLNPSPTTTTHNHTHHTLHPPSRPPLTPPLTVLPHGDIDPLLEPSLIQKKGEKSATLAQYYHYQPAPTP